MPESRRCQLTLCTVSAYASATPHPTIYEAVYAKIRFAWRTRHETHRIAQNVRPIALCTAGCDGRARPARLWPIVGRDGPRAIGGTPATPGRPSHRQCRAGPGQ